MKYQYDRNTNSDQMKAVSGLLEVAQKRSIVEDSWHEGQPLRMSLSLQMKSRIVNKKDEKAKIKPEESKSLQKRHEKDRLNQLVRQQLNNEETYLYEKELPVISERHQHGLKLERNSRLFNTNMTFYGKHKNSNKEFIKSSLTFYGKVDKKANQNHFPQTNHYANINPQSSIVYFKPNKSETIRQLLNRMRVSKNQNNHLILNSKPHLVQEEESQYNQDEAGQLIRYRNSQSFRKQQNSFRMRENIWKRKFKQSWIRKKYDLQDRRSHLKRLIVND